MKTKDLVYIGIIGYLAYLLLKKKETPTAQTSATTNVPVGNASNGGLNLGANMDLPNLTPTPPNGLPTEDALGSSNIFPIVKNDNEPTQIYGNVQLPNPYLGSSIVNPNPVDVLPVNSVPVNETPSNPVLAEPITIVEPIQPIANVETLPTPISSGASLVAEPIFPIKTVSAQLVASQPVLGEPVSLSDDVKNELISECGSSFSIPNYDKEGSYTNYWIDGDTFYMQTSSPLIKTVATKISKDAFIEGCKKFQLTKMQYAETKN
jgi:hypothetical protein